MFKVSRKTRPSFASGFARSQAEAENPWLWDELSFNWDATLGLSGQRAVDISCNKNHGSLENMDGTNWIQSLDGGALNFNGTNEYITIGNKPALQFSTAFTVLAKCSHSDSYTNNLVRGIYNKYTASIGLRAYTIFLYHIHDKRKPWAYVSADGASGVTIDSDYDLSTGWHEIALTFDAGDWIWYVDGKDIASGNVAVSSINNSSTGVSLGVDYNNREWKGPISRIMASSRALAPSEIKQIYDDPHAITRQRPRIYAVTSRQKRWPWQTRRQRRMTGAR